MSPEHDQEYCETCHALQYDIGVKDYHFNHQPFSHAGHLMFAWSGIRLTKAEINYLHIYLDCCRVATPTLKTTF